MSLRRIVKLLPCIFLLASTHGIAAEKIVRVYAVNTQVLLGQVRFSETPYGVLITPRLIGLPSGIHGFHIHEHPNCGQHGSGAGGHWDPKKTNTHLGPYAPGHLGDLPVLSVAADGSASVATLAPRLKLSDLTQHALIIHAGQDTYQDTPPLGGGGPRIACGLFK